ncbi:3-(2,3-dihydroxyphenyl)propionate dioxygenase [Pandoraea captiosa]|jgi:2,3-dihydroxyphenylpropionate 1,2-dioxygenase|uniref:2,3-dihydroxyphenylpropionate/2,3-dihydroxicinnamic acid 1,2-dioxygenase n=1 Tax=Pandoraea captiosa TaxID=2508302 RepID=A0A5E5AGC9_9BURK|nr:3-carboxyethylcatechol 2,3-dioxygenase [Pandoraea captiosa]VVE72731.1 3-(2,3-dihydroxyphenyl)propionate dioxygenase [Pandoraea captiosa]
MPIHLECISHTPLHGYFDPADDVVSEVKRIQEQARERVRAFDPELVVLFAPDHFNGFFYDVMPQFCIGAAATAIGDFKSLAGTLPVPSATAHALTEEVLASEVDVALSYRMQVDHGFAYALEVLTGGLDVYPVVPVFINCVAPPMATLRRARLLGDAIGRHFSQTNKRVLVVGSGGISHEPPVPELIGASEEVAERLIAGRNPSPESRAARQARTVAAAKAFTSGESHMHPLNPQWDRAFLELLASGHLSALDLIDNDTITREGGKSAHEIRTWVAAFAALGAYGEYRASVDYYRAIPEWIAGFAAMHAAPQKTLAAAA